MKTHQTPLANIDPKRTSLIKYYQFAKNTTSQSHEVPIKDQKDPKTIYENTNYTTTPQQNGLQSDIYYEENSQNAIGFFQAKRMMNNRTQMRVEEESNTQTIGRAQENQEKIKINLIDEEKTRKPSQKITAAINCQIKKQAAITLTEKKIGQKKQEKKLIKHLEGELDNEPTLKIDIPINKKVQQIFERQPLRKRFSALLKDQQKYQIGHDHMKLLKILKSIDITIDFATKNRPLKNYFYADLKKNMYDNIRTELTQKHIQQLLFIDDELFRVEWEFNQKIKNHDLLITLPSIRSEDDRLMKARKNIVQYLLAMQVQFLAKSKAEKVKVDGWVDGFDPNKIQIPMKSLPTHPLHRQAELRQLSQTRVNKIQNNNLREFIAEKREESDAKSLRSEEVASMIFAKKSNMSIKERLLQAIREKQAKQAHYSKNQVRVDNQMLTKICDEIMVAYMSKKVTNIFKSTMIQTLNKRLSYKNDQIMVGLDIILQARQIQFLKQVITSSKLVVLQVNKSKFNQMISYLRSKKLD